MAKSRRPKNKSRPAPTTPGSAGASRLLVIGASLIGLHAFATYGMLQTDLGDITSRMWGVDHLRWLPWPVAVGTYLLALLAVIPATNLKIRQTCKAIFNPARIAWLHQHKYALFLLCAIMSVPIFYVAQSKYGLLGDNYLMIQHAERADGQFYEYGAAFLHTG